MKKIIICLILATLLSGEMSAMVKIPVDEVKGAIEMILELISSIISPLTGGESGETTTTTTIEDFVCNPPYIRFGNGCCLDVNENEICDVDEITSTTTVITSTSTTTTTTSTSTTTASTTSITFSTTSIKEIACVMNRDCGEEREEHICRNGDVYLLHTHWACIHPGTKAAKCMERQDPPYLYKKCEENTSCVEKNGMAYCAE